MEVEISFIYEKVNGSVCGLHLEHPAEVVQETRARRERTDIGGASWAEDGAPVSCHAGDFMSSGSRRKKQSHGPLMSLAALWMVRSEETAVMEPC
ncbi:hypothetical protein M0R45_008189 [Rubus argutus]|uniref:Uncharacterized protein n=1 Tax=Rubus argutus TaxID=59490 RepID=A0AAW1Y1A9_RUBAR